MLAFDFFCHVRKAHIPTLYEAALWSGIHVRVAIVFVVGVWMVGGATMGTEYFAYRRLVDRPEARPYSLVA
ncbi:hypothetical protein [Kibdelosporangium aridum]|uniref:hypothetical protein n=1 Tax=Kibdelosporangium aridum TaxID=2030 RepID=UPI0005248F3B